MPSFVLQTDTHENIVYSGQEDNHLGLNRWALKVDKDTIIYTDLKNELKLDEVIDAEVRIRYRQPLQKAKLVLKPDGLYVLFETLQRGITPGQFCAWYKDEELLGSGVIQH
jgi:tRNA-specific 2-thiouridylase